MSNHRLRDTYEDDIDQMIVDNLPWDTRRNIMQFVNASPEMEAVFRHIATLPSWEQRHRVLLTHQEELRAKKYKSTFFPNDALWYIDNILPNKSVTKQVLWWQKWVLPQRGHTIFSYTDNNGLLARYFFAFVVNEDATPDFLTAFHYKLLVTDHGGAAAVVTTPETRWNTINIVVGEPSWKWARYFVNLYTLDLVNHTMKNTKFTYEGIEKFKIQQSPPVTLDIMYISKVAA